MHPLLNQKWFLCLVLSVLTFTIYSFKLSAPFDGMDDQVLIVGNDVIKNPARMKEVFTKPFFLEGNYYRPAVLLSYMLEFKLFGLDPFFYHLTNIILHVCNALFVFLLAHYFFRQQLAAFLVALLFAVHPINWEAAALISGRPILLCTFFFVSGFWAYLRYMKDQKSVRFYFLTVCCFLAGLLCKEEMVMLPVLLAVYEWIEGKAQNKERGQALIRLAPFVLIGIIYFLWRRIIHVAPIAFWASPGEIFKGVATFVWSLIEYMKTFLSPVDIYYDRSEKYIMEWTDLRFGISVLMMIAVGALIYDQRMTMTRPAKFFLFWIFFTFLPVSQIIPINVQIGSAAVSNHFFYLPSIAIFGLVVGGLSILYERWRHRQVVLAQAGRLFFSLLIVYFIIMTVKQNVIAAQPAGIFLQTLYFEPDNVRVRHGLALQYALKKQWLEAEQQFRTVLKFDPLNIGARISLGRVLMEQKRFQEARRELDAIQEAGPFQEILQMNKEALGAVSQ